MCYTLIQFKALLILFVFLVFFGNCTNHISCNNDVWILINYMKADPCIERIILRDNQLTKKVSAWLEKNKLKNSDYIHIGSRRPDFELARISCGVIKNKSKQQLSDLCDRIISKTHDNSQIEIYDLIGGKTDSGYPMILKSEIDLLYEIFLNFGEKL